MEDKALGLPRGSVRALLAIIFSFSLVSLTGAALYFGSQEATALLETVKLLAVSAVSFYFGRSREPEQTKPEQPK